MLRAGSPLLFRFNAKAFLLGLAIVFSAVTWANAENGERAPILPDDASALPVVSRPLNAEPVQLQPPPALPALHPFWDARNRLLFAGIGALRALDHASTRNMQARGREEILLPDEVANNSPGFASLEVAATASSVALSYWMHRTGHHSVERWISILHIGLTGFGAVRNYCLESRHPLPVH